MTGTLPPIPPDGVRVGKRETYELMGPQFAELLERRCALEPDSAVLEVGCGTGRVARGVIPKLSESGRYEGFDIVAESVDWCRREIGSRFPNARFEHSDVHNSHYNPEGTSPASEYRFPYPDQHFDVAYLTSIFTHMLPAEVENYLAQIARTLRGGGSCLITWFLLNDESKRLIETGAAGPNREFSYHGDGYRTISERWPERAVAFEEDYVAEAYSRVGLRVEQPIEYGWWCGRAGAPRERPSRYQDIVVATKP